MRSCYKRNFISSRKHFMFGALIEVGGSNSLSVNTTYNYDEVINDKFNEALKENNIEPDPHGPYAHYLEGKTGAETIPIIKSTIDKLGDDVDEDYWKATEGNAKRSLYILLAFAQMRPDGIWEVY